MKAKLFLLFTSFLFLNVSAQNVWVAHLVTTNADDPYSVAALDIDNDDDLDIISCDRAGGTVTFYRNLGDGDFGDPTSNQNIISENAGGAFEVIASNIGGNEDEDIVFCTIDDDTVAWLENLGAGDFGDPLTNQQLITDPANTDGARSVFAADLNGDGDMDVLSASTLDSKVAWYENLGAGDFGDPLTNQQLITAPENTNSVNTVYAADLDGDNDMDVLSASGMDDKIAWYENLDGLGNFGPQRIISVNAVGAYDVYAAYINDDEYIDVLSASWDDGKIAWYENDGLGNFVEHIISTNLFAADGVFTADLDNDGDLDVLATSWFNVVVWFENTDGEGTFGDENIITEDQERPRQLITMYMDDDADLDVVLVSRGDNTITWFENDFIFAINENTLLDFSVYPSPTSGLLYVKSETPIVQIEIYNLLGQLAESNTNQNTIDISSVSQGIYFIKIKDENGNIGSQKVVKR